MKKLSLVLALTAIIGGSFGFINLHNRLKASEERAQKLEAQLKDITARQKTIADYFDNDIQWREVTDKQIALCASKQSVEDLRQVMVTFSSMMKDRDAVIGQMLVLQKQQIH
jgi:hypothetical protein